MFRLLLGGLERLEALDELAPERLERRVPVEAREAARLEDGVAEVPEQRQRAAVARAGLDLHPLHEADEVVVELHSEAAPFLAQQVAVRDVRESDGDARDTRRRALVSRCGPSVLDHIDRRCTNFSPN